MVLTKKLTEQIEEILNSEFEKIREEVLYKPMIEETYCWIEERLWYVLENELMIRQDELKNLISIYIHNNRNELFIDVNRLVDLED